MTFAAWWKIFVVDFGDWVRSFDFERRVQRSSPRLFHFPFIGGQSAAAVPGWPQKIHTSLVRSCPCLHLFCFISDRFVS
jgi:hypothetical protein